MILGEALNHKFNEEAPEIVVCALPRGILVASFSMFVWPRLEEVCQRMADTDMFYDVKLSRDDKVIVFALAHSHVPKEENLSDIVGQEFSKILNGMYGDASDESACNCPSCSALRALNSILVGKQKGREDEPAPRDAADNSDFEKFIRELVGGLGDEDEKAE